MRKTDGCTNCGEVREIAAHGLCFTCYRRTERAEDQPLVGVDRHNPGVRREHKKLFRGFTSLMVGLGELGASRNDVLNIRRIVDPYLAPIAKFLGPGTGQEKAAGVTRDSGDAGEASTRSSGSDFLALFPEQPKTDGE